MQVNRTKSGPDRALAVAGLLLWFVCVWTACKTFGVKSVDPTPADPLTREELMQDIERLMDESEQKIDEIIQHRTK